MRSTALTEPTLVLNKSWMPLQICTARRAFVLLFKDLALAMGDGFRLHDFESWIREDVDQERHLFVVTSRSHLRVPEVIVLHTCDRFSQPRVAFSRRNLFRRDQHTCQYCGKKGSMDELSIDHIVPRSLGGVGSWTNCVVACRRCNERKANRPLKHSGLRLLRQPTEPPAHMAFTTYIGRRKESWKQFVGS